MIVVVLQQMGQQASGPFSGGSQARGMTVQSGGSGGHRFLHPWTLPAKSDVGPGGVPFFARRTADLERHAKNPEPPAGENRSKTPCINLSASVPLEIGF